MFSADSANLVDESRPMASFSLDEGKNGDVFLDGPGALADVGAKVVEPMLAALLGCLVVLAFRAKEQAAGDITPFAVN